MIGNCDLGEKEPEGLGRTGSGKIRWKIWQDQTRIPGSLPEVLRFRGLRLGAVLVLAAGMLVACGEKAEPLVIGTEAVAGKDAGAGTEAAIVLEPEAGAGGAAGVQGGAGTAGAQSGGDGSVNQPEAGGMAGTAGGSGGAGTGSGASGKADQSGTGGKTGSGDSQADQAKKDRFGEDCIAAQTFEVELSQHTGKVWFVPYRPAEPGQDLHMQIVQNGQILTEIPVYVPEGVAQENFESLDAVSFYDINYDGNTDILTIATYGERQIAAIYYGYILDQDNGSDLYFAAREGLSDKVTAQVEPLTVSQIRIYLSWGKKNGDFAGWQEAYETVARLCQVEHDGTYRYELMDFDGDSIPELAAGNAGNISLYTYSGGTVYTLMDQWSYGAMGNTGYEYSPGKNSLRNYNTDYAGAILYTSYMTAGSSHALETVVVITSFNFDDANGNGVPDPEEEDSIGRYGVNYIDGKEATAEQCASYDAGGYVYMDPELTFEELQGKLGV